MLVKLESRAGVAPASTALQAAAWAARPTGSNLDRFVLDFGNRPCTSFAHAFRADNSDVRGGRDCAHSARISFFHTGKNVRGWKKRRLPGSREAFRKISGIF